MNINIIKSLFEVEMVELDNWSKRPYKNNFFEIVYIESGTGTQCINYNEFEYHSGNIFLLPPLNCHFFTIEESTKFYFVRFSDQYFQNKSLMENYMEWFEKISYILVNYNRIPGDIISSEYEREYIIGTIKCIYNEFNVVNSYSEAIISGSIASILNILARCIEQKSIDSTTSHDSRFGLILRYVNKNLLDGEKLKIAALADKFNVSKTYFSEYFKKESGVNFAEYVIKLKLKLVETYIIHTDQSVKEIAQKLNFSDSSHLSNTFKRYYNMTLREFKEQSKI